MPEARVAVAGCGYWGKNLVRSFHELGALQAIVDPDMAVAQELAGKYGVEALGFEAMLARADIDGVVIAAPAEYHARMAIAAFNAGKHVYVEKPLALTYEDGQAMVAAAAKAGRQLMVGHLLQYHPAFEALLATVRGGQLGDVRYAYSNRLSLGRFRVEENALWSFAPHDLSMLLALFNDEAPEAVTATGGAYLTAGIEDECRLDLAFSGGRHAHVFSSWLHPFKEQRLVVVGSKAMAVFEDHVAAENKLRLYRTTVDTSGPVPVATKGDAEPIPYTADEPLKRECRHFLDCIENQSTPRTDGVEALRVLKVLMQGQAQLDRHRSFGEILENA